MGVEDGGRGWATKGEGCGVGWGLGGTGWGMRGEGRMMSTTYPYHPHTHVCMWVKGQKRFCEMTPPHTSLRVWPKP